MAAQLQNREVNLNETSQRRLLRRDQVIELLNLSADDIQWLVNTKQLLEIPIRGQQLFDSRDVFQLIDTYKNLTLRQRNNEHEA